MKNFLVTYNGHTIRGFSKDGQRFFASADVCESVKMNPRSLAGTMSTLLLNEGDAAAIKVRGFRGLILSLEALEAAAVRRKHEELKKFCEWARGELTVQDKAIEQQLVPSQPIVPEPDDSADIAELVDDDWQEFMPTLGVKISGGRVMVSSLDVARVFEKNHKDVLRSIESLDCSFDFQERNFAPNKYQDKIGRSLPMYYMTRDGFTFLAMGFTGAKAAHFKEAYIKAFNELEAQLHDNGGAMTVKALTNPDFVRQALSVLSQTQERVLMLEQHCGKLESQIEAAQPKVDYCDAVASADGCISVRMLAKLLRQNGVKLGSTRLFEWMRQNGFLCKSRKGNEPTQRAMDMHLFKVRQVYIPHNGNTLIVHQPMVTGKGQVYFVTQFLRMKAEALMRCEEYAEIEE